MTDIDDDRAAGNALTPIPARETGVYQAEIGVAQLMAKSSLLPKHLHGNPGNCLAVLMLSRDWNMNPIAVGLKTSVIPKKGGGETLMFEGQLVNAVIGKSKEVNGRLKFDLSGKGETTTCIVRGTLRGESEERTVNVGMPKTRNSPLWSGNQGDIEQQLTYLAARTWARRHIPEVLLGVYTPEDDWTEREPDAVSERRSAVASRMAALENQASPGTGIPAEGKDDFIDAEPVIERGPANVPGGVMSMKAGTVPGQMAEGLRLAGLPDDEDGRQITNNPEDRTDPMDEEIPDFGPAKCKTCDGKGSVPFKDNDGEGIQPCPDCGPKPKEGM